MLHTLCLIVASIAAAWATIAFILVFRQKLHSARLNFYIKRMHRDARRAGLNIYTGKRATND